MSKHPTFLDAKSRRAFSLRDAVDVSLHRFLSIFNKDMRATTFNVVTNSATDFFICRDMLKLIQQLIVIKNVVCMLYSE